jgi:hypothetical protein
MNMGKNWNGTSVKRWHLYQWVPVFCCSDEPAGADWYHPAPHECSDEPAGTDCPVFVPTGVTGVSCSTKRQYRPFLNVSICLSAEIHRPSWTEIRCLAVGKAPMNSTIHCTSILAVGSRIDGPDDMNSPSLQCPATVRVVQWFVYSEAPDLSPSQLPTHLTPNQKSGVDELVSQNVASSKFYSE